MYRTYLRTVLWWGKQEKEKWLSRPIFYFCFSA